MNFPMTSAASIPNIPPQSQIQAGEAIPAIPEISKIRELAEQIRQRCTHAHLAGQHQTAAFQVFNVPMYVQVDMDLMVSPV